MLRRAATEASPPARVLLVDAAGGELAEAAPRVLGVWRDFDAVPDAEVDQARFARTIPVIELLDEEVDLTPARRQPAVGSEVSGEQLTRTRERLAAVVALPALMPPATPAPDGAAGQFLTVGELLRAGALHLLGPVRAGVSEPAPDGPPVLTVGDVLAGAQASGRIDDRYGQQIPLEVRDVVVPVVAQQRAYGEAARRLDAFEQALRQAATLGAELVQLTAGGLAPGAIRPT
ncbi:hypothetical protein ACQP1S_16490 [Micromonospora matsumotoense]|uniref:hypothetical protein n=1 Tax=Micromonospora matsumotoense TaxID=121616 RepID=UPI003D8B849B